MRALRIKLAWVAAAAIAGSGFVASTWPAALHWIERAPSLGWVNEADALGLEFVAAMSAQANQIQKVSVGVASAGYANPFRGVSGLVPERIDEGVDFNGTGPVYALGDAIVTNATGTNWGWPGGGWITYQLTDGPDAGLMVYVAENITPAVAVGQRVSRYTVIGYMYAGGNGIEIGWAQLSGLSSESELPEAGGIGGYGPFPTRVGANFDALLQWLGVPPAPNSGQIAYGLLPAYIPAHQG